MRKLQIAETSKLKKMRRVEKRLTAVELEFPKLSVEIQKGVAFFFFQMSSSRPTEKNKGGD